MTAQYTFNSSGDKRNDGWAITGASSLNAAWQSTSSDTIYASTPASKGIATIQFPQDITAIPAGAIISSVSVYMRVATGSGSIPAGSAPVVTVSMQAGDDTASFTATTLSSITSTKQTLEVATFTTDPTAQPWDIERLNNLLIRCYSTLGVADAIRVYQFYAVINYQFAPAVSITAPSGTINTSAPALSWTYSQPDGDKLESTEFRIFTAAQQSDVSFSPDATLPVYDAEVEGDVLSVTLPSLPSGSYWVYLRSTTEFGAVSPWDSHQFTLNAPAPGTPGIPDPTGSAPTGSAIVSVVQDEELGAALLTLQNTTNLVGTAMADVLTNSDNETWKGSGCAVTEQSAVTFPGSQASWMVQASSSGNMIATTGYFVANELTDYCVRAQVFAGTTGRTVSSVLTAWDQDYTLLDTNYGATFTDSTSTWQELVTNYTTPPFTKYLQLSIQFSSVANTEQHYLDHIGIMPGTDTDWSSGGFAASNLLSSWYSNAEGTAPSGQSWTAGVACTTGTLSTSGIGTAGAEGNTCNTLTYNGGSSSIGWRAAGTNFSTTSAATSFTLNKPSSAATGDLLLAFVTAITTATETMTPPTGWSLVDVATSSSDSVMWILGRTVAAGDPSSWTGSISASVTRLGSSVVAYSGAAPLANQFLAENSTATTLSSNSFSTTVVTNTDPTAWRVSAFAGHDSATGGTWTANTQPYGGYPIQFVASAAPWDATDATDAYTINCPPGIQSGDLMVATVTADNLAGTISAPTGWTIVDNIIGTITGIGSLATAVLKRTATGSEPASWAGTFSGTIGSTKAYPKMAECQAYRNAAPASSQFLSDHYGTANNSTTINTPSRTNPQAGSWRICSFSGSSDDLASWTLGDVAFRCNDSLGLLPKDGGISGMSTVAVSDSNGPVGAGADSVAGELSEAFSSAAAWIGFIIPATVGSPPGNETSRDTLAFGASSIYDSLAVFDSNGPVPAGPMSVTGSYSHTFSSAAAWIGIIESSTPIVGGLASASIAAPIDISMITEGVTDIAGAQLTLGGSFTGTSAGSTLFTCYFYRANQLMSQVTLPGGSFGAEATAPWQPSSATFEIPDGTTRVAMGFSVPGRNVSDVVYFDRMQMALGADTDYRQGTSYVAHPIWCYPQIQYCQDDGDGTGWDDWQFVPGTSTNVPSFVGDELLVFFDHTVVPLVPRRYRARTISYGLNGDQFTSPWGPPSAPVVITASNWWIKDISDPSNNLQLKVKWEDFSVTHQNSGVQFQALGEQYPVVLTEGFHSDTFTLKLIPVQIDEYQQLMTTLTSGETLFLQSDMDRTWWVVPLGDITDTVLATNRRQIDPQREIDVIFLEVAPLA